MALLTIQRVWHSFRLLGRGKGIPFGDTTVIVLLPLKRKMIANQLVDGRLPKPTPSVTMGA